MKHDLLQGDGCLFKQHKMERYRPVLIFFLICEILRCKLISKQHLSREVFHVMKWFAQGEDGLRKTVCLLSSVEGQDEFLPRALPWPCQQVPSWHWI